MGYAAGEAPAFQRALQAASGLLASIRPQDHCTVVTTSAPARSGDPRRRGLAPRRDLRGRGVACRLTATHAAWPAVLEGVDEVLRSCTYPTRQLTILTDLRKSGLGCRRRRRSAGGGASRTSACGSWMSAATRPPTLSLQALVAADRTILAGAAERAGRR